MSRNFEDTDDLIYAQNCIADYLSRFAAQEEVHHTQGSLTEVMNGEVYSSGEIVDNIGNVMIHLVREVYYPNVPTAVGERDGRSAVVHRYYVRGEEFKLISASGTRFGYDMELPASFEFEGDEAAFWAWLDTQIDSVDSETMAKDYQRRNPDATTKDSPRFLPNVNGRLVEDGDEWIVEQDD